MVRVDASEAVARVDGAHAAIVELRDPRGWTFVLKKHGVSVWKRGATAAENAPFAVKATVAVPTPPATVAALLLTRDYSVVRAFNPTIESGRDLQVNHVERVTHVLTKPVWPLRARDFVCRVRHEQHAGTHLIINSPTTDRRAPPTSDCVRGTLRGFHLIEPQAHGTGCVYTCIHEIDPGGAAPRRLVNWFATRRPLQYMTALRTLAIETAAVGTAVEPAATNAPRAAIA